MNDKELLELAAKSIFECFGAQMIESGWNPLTDDGDALRLAVKLDMTIIVTAKSSISVCVGLKGFLEEEINGDIYAATRRAIVRAAAEIGKTL
jgi:hypothetical protein